MYAKVDKQKQNNFATTGQKRRPFANSVTQKKSNERKGFGFADNKTIHLGNPFILLAGKKGTIQRVLKFTKTAYGWTYSGRPDWTSDTKEDVKVSAGQHRRHIIPSHLLLKALTAYANSVNNDQILAQEISKSMGFSTGSLAKDLAQVAKIVHSNPNNLFPEDGGENTAIGFFAHKVGEAINLLEDFELPGQVEPEIMRELKGRVYQILSKGLDKGFKFTEAHRRFLEEHINVTLAQLQATTVRDLVNYLTDLESSLEFDLNKSTGFKNQTIAAIGIFKKFTDLANTGQGNYWDIVNEFFQMPSDN